MNISATTVGNGEMQALIDAMSQNSTSDGLAFPLTQQQWVVLGSYLQQLSISAGQVLVTLGEQDRSLYLVENGSLSVHSEDTNGRIRMAMVAAGSVVGEGCFFSNLPRCATVQAAGASVLWRLSPTRFSELSNRQPAVATQVVMALAGLMAKRMRSRSRRYAVT